MKLSIETNVLTDFDDAFVELCQDISISEHDWQTWFEAWLNDLQPNASPIHAYALSLRLTQDRQMQHFNSNYRHIDKTTDVLAFASLEQQSLPSQIWESQPLELGDIIISIETARRQAQEHHHSLVQELAWLASHGLLHLLGWDHPNDEELEKMLNQQRQLLSLVGLTS